MASGKLAFIQRNRSSYQPMRQLRVEPALQQDLHAAEVDRLLELLGQLLARQHVALGLVGGRAVEVAELAARDADVRVVDVAIDDVGDDVVGVERAAALVGGGAELERGRVGVEAQAVVGRRGARRRRRRRGARRSNGDWDGALPDGRLAGRAIGGARCSYSRGADGRETQPGAAGAVEEGRRARTAPRRRGRSGCCR